MKRSCNNPERSWQPDWKGLHGDGVWQWVAAMILTASGSELDPIYDSFAPVVALTPAPWNNWLSQATVAKCINIARRRGSPSKSLFWSGRDNAQARAVDDPGA